MNKHTESLDEILANYRDASETFDPKVLHDFLQRYEEHADALNRYAQVQLSSLRATPAEVAEVELSDEEMLPMQSKMLERLQQQRAAAIPASASNGGDAQAVSSGLGTISGNKAIEAATVAVFGACNHGQDDLLLLVMEPPGVVDVPEWVYSGLAAHVNIPKSSLQAGLRSRMAAGAQRFSSAGKPADTEALTWEQAVQQAITDHSTQQAILRKS